MEREDRERIKNHIVEYFHSRDGEGVKKKRPLHIFRSKRKVKEQW
jgi:hypothetical protein